MSKKADGNLKLALKTFVRIVISTILCVFMYFSVSIITLGILGKNVGYYVFETTESGENKLVEEHRYAVGEEEVTSLELPSGQFMQTIREVPSGVQTGADIIVQIMMLVLVGAFPYGNMWSVGDKDSNGVRFHRKKPQLWRGLHIGLLANIPHFLLYLGLFVAKMGVLPASYPVIFKLINLPYTPYVNMILAGATDASALSVWQILGLLPVVLVVPAVCCGAYILGFKQISLHERATYANIGKGNPDTEI